MTQYVGLEFKHSCLPALAAGKSGQPETLIVGGAKAIGKIVFTGVIIATDTVTVNGVVHTCMASGAAGEAQFNVAGSLSLTLDALVTLLNASTNPLVSYATYSKTDTNSALTSTSDGYDDADNLKLLASNHATVVVTQPVGGMDKPAISLETENTVINVAAAKDFTIAAGDEFQRKKILNVGAGDAVVTGNFLSSGVTLTLNQNEWADLLYLNGEWKTVSNTGAIT